MVQDEIAVQLARGRRHRCGLRLRLSPGGRGALAIADHPWRKPQPGMFREANKVLGVELSRSLVVGDRLSDLEAGRGAGVPEGAIVRTGYGAGEADRLIERSEAMACERIFRPTSPTTPRRRSGDGRAIRRTAMAPDRPADAGVSSSMSLPARDRRREVSLFDAVSLTWAKALR